MARSLFAHVAGEDRGLVRQQEIRRRQRALFRRQLDGERRLPLVDRRLDLAEHRVLRHRPLVAALGVLGEALAPLLHDLEVGEHELGVDDVDVADGIDGSGDVMDVRVFEAADDLHDRIDFADVGQELVPQSFAGARALDQAGDVDELDCGRNHDVGLGDPLQLGQPCVGDRDDADVGVDRAERIVGRLGVARAGDGVEQRGLAHVRQSDDSGSEHACFEGRPAAFALRASAADCATPCMYPGAAAADDRTTAGVAVHPARAPAASSRATPCRSRATCRCRRRYRHTDRRLRPSQV